jgi:outer membrane receptor protein involved in Fe transport
VSEYPGRLEGTQSTVVYEFRSAGGRLVNLGGIRYNTFLARGNASPLYTLVQGQPPAYRIDSRAAGFSDAVRWRFGQDWYVKGSIERGMRSPTPQELFGDGSLIAPAPGLTPERSWSTSIGVFYDAARRDNGRVQIDASLFHLHVSDLITLGGAGFFRGYVNTGKARIAGADVDIRADVTPFVFVYGNATVQDLRDAARFLPGTSVANPTFGLRIPNVPWFFGTGGIEWRPRLGGHDGTRLFYEASYTHRYFYAFQVSVHQDRVIPASLLQDAGIEYRVLRSSLTISGEIHNLFDARALNLFFNPLPGRTVRLKVRYTNLRAP